MKWPNSWTDTRTPSTTMSETTVRSTRPPGRAGAPAPRVFGDDALDDFRDPPERNPLLQKQLDGDLIRRVESRRCRAANARRRAADRVCREAIDLERLE